MSRTKPRSTGGSPVKVNITWKGSEGVVDMYNKTSKTSTQVKEMEFLLLDETHTVGGFSPEGKRISGTDIHSFDEPIQTYIGGVKGPKDTYTELKKIPGLKYTKNLYAAVTVAGTTYFGVIKLSGAAFSAWMDFNSGEGDYSKSKAVESLYTGGFKITGKSKPKKKGAVTYFCPVFEEMVPEPDQVEMADEYDSELQTYFVSRSGSTKVEEKVEQEGLVDDLPFD